MEWNHEKIMRVAKQYYKDKMLIACELLETDMKQKTSGNQGPDLKAVFYGNFLSSFVNKVIEAPDEIIGLVGNTAEYAPYIEFGTGEFAEGGQGKKDGWWYVITGVSTTEQFGTTNWKQYYFTLGMKPRPILRTALIDKKKEILELFKNK